MEVKPLRYFSHSRVEKDADCERARYYASEFGGTGLQPTTAGFDLIFGNVQHKHLNVFVQTGTIEFKTARTEVYNAAVAAGLDATVARDYSLVAEGQLRGFVRYIWPLWVSEFEVVEAETMRRWEVRPGYIFRYKQDLLLRRRTTGVLVYPDYKTTSSNDPKWITSWQKSPQLHSSLYAMKQGYGIDIDHALIVGLYKGYKDKWQGGIASPFAYGWVNREYALKPQYAYSRPKYYKGWEKFSTADEFTDLGQWIANMPEQILQEQFPCSAPVFLNERIGEQYFAQQIMREEEIQQALELLNKSTNLTEIDAILNKHFRQNFSNCQPSFGYACEFLNICWLPSVAADPLGSGQFVRKEPAEVETLQ